MKIIGIDPGFAVLGWSVIDSSSNTIIDYGTIETSKDLPIDDRLLEIHRSLNNIIGKHKPASASIEKVFFKKNSKTVIDVAKTIGVIQLTFKLHNLDYGEYTPTQVKHAITGYGRASKNQIQLMIKRIFNIKELPRPDDAADALAIALCHSFRKKDLFYGS